jgi:hypothetical protein
MQTRYALLTLLVCPALFGAPFLPGIDFSGGTQGLVTAINLDFYGSSFTVGADPILVTALGVSSVSNGGIVRIYRNGIQTTLATATIDLTDLLSDDGRIRFEDITPLALLPLTSYTVIARINDGDFLLRQATGMTIQPGITFLGARAGGALVPYPAVDGDAKGPYFGPTFQFTIQPQVPEPSTLGLVAIGLLAALAKKCRRRP